VGVTARDGPFPNLSKIKPDVCRPAGVIDGLTSHHPRAIKWICRAIVRHVATPHTARSQRWRAGAMSPVAVSVSENAR